MSTAYSILLSISSIITKDIYTRLINPDAGKRHLTWVGKLFSWVLISILVGLAIALREQTTLISLIDRKFDVPFQLVPAHHRHSLASPVYDTGAAGNSCGHNRFTGSGFCLF